MTFNGLSKSHRIPGMRVGWMIVSGKKAMAADYTADGLDTLANMRMCGNMVGQRRDPDGPGRLPEPHQVDLAGRETVRAERRRIRGLSLDPRHHMCKTMRGALYLFPKIDTKRYNIGDDQQFLLDFLIEKQVLLVHGTG